MARTRKEQKISAPQVALEAEAVETETVKAAEDVQEELQIPDSQKDIEDVIIEKVAEPEIKSEVPENVQRVVYQNVGDQVMTLYHLYPNRTPISYGVNKKKVFNKFGEKWSITVREFEQEFAPSPVAEALLKDKIIAIGDDCPSEIRERLDIDYSDAELITPEKYKLLLTLDTKDICELFEALCTEHKRLMVGIFATDFEHNEGRNCQRDKIKALNDISKKYVGEKEPGMFAPLLKAITDKEEVDY